MTRRRAMRRGALPIGVAVGLLLTAMSDCSGTEVLFQYLSQRDTPAAGIAPILDYPLPNGCSTYIFFDDTGLEVDALSSIERPARIAFCTFNDSTSTPLALEIEGPDGSVHSSATIDPGGRSEVFVDIRITDALGTYVVRASGGEELEEATMSVTTDTTETRVLVTPRRAPRGTTFSVDFANVGADEALYLYKLFDLESGECDAIDVDGYACWVYLTAIPVPPDAAVTGRRTLQTYADDPPGTYMVTADPEHSEFWWAVPELFIVD
jgi:hypothetical protein